MVIVSNPCVFCHKIHEVEIPEEGYFNWFFNGMAIQNAMPNTPAEDREFLISGICPTCWDNTWEPDDDDGAF